MYTRVFEANSLDEAFRNIKKELGPDAIIIKTVTNKGLKGAFKKSRVEVHAAISEKNYIKKSKVDNVLDGKQKEKLYSGPSHVISNVIDSYDENTTPLIRNSGYGNMALNRPVKTVKKNIGEKIKSGLDEFLGGELLNTKSSLKETDLKRAEIKPNVQSVDYPSAKTSETKNFSGDIYKELYELQREKSLEFEKRLNELTKEVRSLDQKGPSGIYRLRSTLRTFDISEKFITDICKKALFDLSTKEAEDADIVFEFSLKEMLKVVKVERPLFSSEKVEGRPVVTVFIGGKSSGQSSIIRKIAALRPDSIIIRCKNPQMVFAENVFEIEAVEANSIAEVVTQTRKYRDAGRDIFIDYNNFSAEFNETKKFVEGLRRSFEHVEVFISISAIHSEIYTRRKINEYRPLSDGIVASNLDLCLNFGSLFNIAEDAFDLPFKFFGTGEVVPDDIEAATPERILAGIFQLG